jgi:anaerobic ribonucleoside-triphosphate reductase activating protein
MTSIAISRVHFPVTTLGPGRRLGLWMQGCSIRCPGCISADTWAAGRGIVALPELLQQMAPWLDEAEGITISGGEPFDQPEALGALLTELRARSAVDILVYSGHPFERIATQVAQMNGLIDALMTDPYLSDAPQTLALRGSDNQRLHCLTASGETRFGALRNAPAEKAALDVMFDDDGSVWFAGIPARDDWERLQRRLASLSTKLTTSMDASPRAGRATDR